MREAVVMQMTWMGAPTIYYGDEAGLTGFTDPDNRRTYPWGRENEALLRFHRAAIKIHKAYPALVHGSLVFLLGDYQVIAYARFTRRQQLVVIINNSDEEKELAVPVLPAGIERDRVVRRVFHTNREGYNEEFADYSVKDTYMHVHMEPRSSGVYLAI